MGVCESKNLAAASFDPLGSDNLLSMLSFLLGSVVQREAPLYRLSLCTTCTCLDAAQQAPPIRTSLDHKRNNLSKRSVQDRCLLPQPVRLTESHDTQERMNHILCGEQEKKKKRCSQRQPGDRTAVRRQQSVGVCDRSTSPNPPPQTKNGDFSGIPTTATNLLAKPRGTQPCHIEAPPQGRRGGVATTVRGCGSLHAALHVRVCRQRG